MKAQLKLLLKEKSELIHNVSQTETVYEVVKKMNQENVGSVLVMENEELLGIFTERDILRKLIGKGLDPMQTKVKALMTSKSDLITVPPEMTVSEAMRIVIEKRIRHLPVIKNKKLIGLISIGDLTKWILSEQEEQISSLTGYISGNFN